MICCGPCLSLITTPRMAQKYCVRTQCCQRQADRNRACQFLSVLVISVLFKLIVHNTSSPGPSRTIYLPFQDVFRAAVVSKLVYAPAWSELCSARDRLHDLTLSCDAVNDMDTVQMTCWVGYSIACVFSRIVVFTAGHQDCRAVTRTAIKND